MRQSTTNQWQKGLNLDASSIAMTNQLLAGALNATMVTMNGNEMILQNDMGNARVEDAYLPAGYVPVGMLEFGGIVYVASYNPLTNSSQIGCFPSPERNISSDEVGDTTKEFNSFCQDPISNYVQKLKLTPDVIRPGDKFSIEMVDINLFKELVLLISKGVVIFSVAVIDESGNLIEIKNEDLYKYNYNLSTSEPTILGENPEGTLWKDYYSVPIYLKHGDEVGQEKLRKYSVYKNKLVGDLYLILKLNVPEVAEPLIEGDTLNTDLDYYSVLYKTGGELVQTTKPIIGVHFPTYYSAMDGYEAKLFNDAGLKCKIHSCRKWEDGKWIDRTLINGTWVPIEGLNFYTIDEVYTGNNQDEFANSDKTIWLEPAGDNPAQYVLYDNKCYCKLKDATPIISTWHCEFHNSSEAEGAQDTSVDITSSNPAYYIDVKNKAGKVVEGPAVEYNYVMQLNKKEFADTDTLTYTITPVISLPMLNGETCTGALKHSSITGTYLLSKIGTDELEILLSYWVDIINNDLYLSFNNLSYLRRDHIIVKSELSLRDFVCSKLDLTEYTRLPLSLRDRYTSYIERLPLIEHKIGDIFNVTGNKRKGDEEIIRPGYNFEPYVVKNSIYPDSQVIYEIQSKYALNDNDCIEITSAKTDLITFNPEITLTCDEKIYDLQKTDNTECTIEDNGLYTITYKPKLTLSQYGELQLTTNSLAITVTNPIVRADASELKYLFSSEEDSWYGDGPNKSITVNKTLVEVTIIGPTFNSCATKITPNSFTLVYAGTTKGGENLRAYARTALYSEDFKDVQVINSEKLGDYMKYATMDIIKRCANFKKGEFYIFGGPLYRLPMVPTWAGVTSAGKLVIGPIYLLTNHEGNIEIDHGYYLWHGDDKSTTFGNASLGSDAMRDEIKACIEYWATAHYLNNMPLGEAGLDNDGTMVWGFEKDTRFPKLYRIVTFPAKTNEILLANDNSRFNGFMQNNVAARLGYARFPVDLFDWIDAKYPGKLISRDGQYIKVNFTQHEFFTYALEYLNYLYKSGENIINNIVNELACVYIKNSELISKVKSSMPALATTLPDGFSTALWDLVYDCKTGRELNFSYKNKEYIRSDFSSEIEIYNFDKKLLKDETQVTYTSKHSQALKNVLGFTNIQQISISNGTTISGTILAGTSNEIPLPNTTIGSKIYYYKSISEHGIPKYLLTNTSGQLIIDPNIQLTTTDATEQIDIVGLGSGALPKDIHLDLDDMTDHLKTLPDPYIFWGNIFDYTADE